MSVKKYTVTLPDIAELKFEVDHDVISAEKFEEVHHNWAKQEPELEPCESSLNAVLALISFEVILMTLSDRLEKGEVIGDFKDKLKGIKLLDIEIYVLRNPVGFKVNSESNLEVGK